MVFIENESSSWSKAFRVYINEKIHKSHIILDHGVSTQGQMKMLEMFSFGMNPIDLQLKELFLGRPLTTIGVVFGICLNIVTFAVL